MHTIVLATQKGGSGKSTLAIGLALAAMQDGHAVRLIETDPQGTLSNWQRRRDNDQPVVETITSAEDIEARLQIFDRSGITLTIIDTAGGISALTAAAIGFANLCLIPVRPSLADIEATAPTLRTARAAGVPFAFVLNQTAVHGRRINCAILALGDEAAADLAGLLAQPCIVMRNDHQDALAHGLAVGEFAPTGKSAEEIRGLWQWAIDKLTVVTLVPELDATRNIDDAPALQPGLYAPIAERAIALD
jgi:chromosome partitioning protein